MDAWGILVEHSSVEGDAWTRLNNLTGDSAGGLNIYAEGILVELVVDDVNVDIESDEVLVEVSEKEISVETESDEIVVEISDGE